MEYRYLKVEKKDGKCVIAINRPEKLNALSGELLKELECAFYEVCDDGSTGVLVITGTGKAFVAGADIGEMKGFGSIEAEQYSLQGQRVFGMLEKMEIPVIAAINGYALGGGLELALSCDFRIASENAMIGLPEITLGLVPGFGGTQKLARIVGIARAKQMVMLGERISAAEACHIGLVHRVVKAEDLEKEVDALAAKLLGLGRVALKTAKYLINASADLPLAEGLNMEARAFALLFSGNEAKEGIEAFLSKRKPEFRRG
ncbi:MAG: enoyl-CoA hydratase-related protein [Thermoplasmata archaeon]|nr:enoyl-CoA hydratase-related protein [Thermoplasmata archaeon]